MRFKPIICLNFVYFVLNGLKRFKYIYIYMYLNLLKPINLVKLY